MGVFTVMMLTEKLTEQYNSQLKSAKRDWPPRGNVGKRRRFDGDKQDEIQREYNQRYGGEHRHEDKR